MQIGRFLFESLKANKKSVLLIGPRQTGKSTLIKSLLPDLAINLSNEQVYLDFAKNPSELEERLAARQYKTVFIDEIQRLPGLLNTVQSVIDDLSAPPKFYLTGSSARKLRRGKANLLPGRIHTFFLGPLCCAELGYEIHLQQALKTGTLPGIYTGASAEEREKTLRSYSSTYLKEEIQAEALTENLEGFARFLFVAAACSGQFLDITKLSSEAGINRQSATRYFEILEDTLIVRRLLPFASTDRKRLVQHPKFYFFDNGVLNALLGNFEASEDRKGMLFEHLFFNQLCDSAAAHDKEIRISTYRTKHGAEVDFIVEIGKTIWACELKASRNIGASDLRGLGNFADFIGKPHRSVLAYWGTAEKKIGRVEVLPWQEVFRKMGL